MSTTPKRRLAKKPARADIAALVTTLTETTAKGTAKAPEEDSATPPATLTRTATQPNPTTLAVRDDNFHWVPAGSIDLVLTDPPFNIARDTNFHTWENNKVNSYRFDKEKGWDTYTPDSFKELLNEWAKEFARVLRPGGSFAIFCADTYLSHLKDALTEAGLSPRRTLTWRKPNAVPVNRKAMMMSACEYVVVGVKGKNATFNADLYLTDIADHAAIEQVIVADKAAAIAEKAVRDELATLQVTDLAQDNRQAAIADAVRRAVTNAADAAATKAAAMYTTDENNQRYLRACVPNAVAFNSKAGNRLHPTEKPVSLLAYLVLLLSNKDDVILDPFGGSGSTGEAARSSQRSAIIVERDPEFFEKLNTRLSALN